MKNMFKVALLAAAPVATISMIPASASAQAVSNVAVANLDQAVQGSAAYAAAIAQIRTTYKAQIDSFEARSKALNAEIQPLVTAFQTAQRAPNANQQALQTQAQNIQNRQQAAQRELAGIFQPVSRAQAYVEEQIVSKLDAALKAAMTKKRVTMVVRPEATISYQPTMDITADITTELNTAVPSVSITPPANWQPGGQQQPAAGAAAPAAPTPPKPQGR
jgi:Skp family chaperone for outer membrane proteins